MRYLGRSGRRAEGPLVEEPVDRDTDLVAVIRRDDREIVLVLEIDGHVVGNR